MTPVYRPGGFTDVFVLLDGRLGQVAVEGASVSCYVEDVLFWQQDAPEALLFCRAAVHDGLVFSIHQGQSGRAWIVRQGDAHDMGPTFGVQPVAINAVSAYVVRSNQQYDRIDLTTGAVLTLPHGCPGSSQGISDLAEDGSIWWADLHRTIVDGLLTLTYPNRRGNLLVGQADPPQIVGVMRHVSGTLVLGDAFEPHVAHAPMNGRYAVCARTPHGAAYVVLPTLATAVPPVVYDHGALKKCEVSVDAFTLTPAAQLPDGGVMEFYDRENAIGTRVRVWVEGGSCRMSIDYPGAGAGLKGETGARRPVR